MKIIKNIEEIRNITKELRASGKSIGMVPTMGCLHEGHKSLIDKAVANNDIVVVSIFVNPIQFGPGEDYDKYPRDLKADASLCESAGVDYVFAPEAEQMYPDGYSTFVVPSEKMTDIMCGKSRPGHFRGVCTVLTKLFTIVGPTRAYFGEKDIQQLAIVKRMVKDFNLPLEIIGCPIIREEDGLAKSSRNMYLSPKEREAATILRKSLLSAKDMVEGGEKSPEKIYNKVIEVIKSEELARVDYVELVDFDTFDRIDTLAETNLIAMAVYIGNTRLIDNIVINR
ncbi:pantoate--beta-alanine ligase [Peptostreptococcus anaerobius]|uniref:pantoate--beta-alanine ligase n=1 Tax=Peptostreptococcus TaxID=1257 RepID=UPI001D6B69B8|nr:MULTISPECIES: pantoate--beta-alanine ligase [Peptostreptococcus]MBS5597040.1 pantoate--beta-alanine ligase [Peptostreptococcus sp.]MDB8850613.1 pantoate--beta-alanine ligase [Peptostreptococcus anaerobius]MDB8854316.1 pantoate--beta-alanine ligase [Peptostreptococcus anaerobius]MDB8856198.1 pantoate--beta-alanine ligase [Peptostreptococcus anaerobius]